MNGEFMDDEFKVITDRVFRANPLYDLVLFDRLAKLDQEALRDLRKSADFFGVLISREGSGLGSKAATRDTALLFFTLRESGAIPAYVRDIAGDRANREIAELVLDGVLEIEEGGEFVSGPKALRIVRRDRVRAAGGALARVSEAALRYGQQLDIPEATKLAARMYFFNRIPAARRWRDQFPNPQAVAEYLGVDSPACKTILQRDWSRMDAPGGQDGWLIWRSRSLSRRSDSRATFKLYISPRCQDLPEVFRTVVETLPCETATNFKAGNSMFGLLRPDKLIVYFSNLADLRQVGELLGSRLHGYPAHGVPFTSELSHDGLLSWGLDPPRNTHLISWQERESWRVWVANRLATYLLLAKSEGLSTLEPWMFALERLRCEGVDTDDWTPSESLWRSEDEHA
jgi:hypothetical protein